jgi:hypothetical protein
MVYLAVITLSLANLPAAVFSEEIDDVVIEQTMTGDEADDDTEASTTESDENDDENDESGIDNDPATSVYISEIYANPSDVTQKYIELYFSADVAEGSYFIQTATSEEGSLSGRFIINLPAQPADNYYLIPNEIPSGLNLTNPASQKFVWLCPSLTGDGKAMMQGTCRSGGYLDKVVYTNHNALSSFSRDFSDEELPFKLAILTPNEPNRFPTTPNENENEDETATDLDRCAAISFNEISFSDPEKFIEIINTTARTIDLTDCALRRGNSYIYLDGDLLPAEIKSFSVSDSSLTQTNSSVNIYVYDILQKQNVVTVNYKARSGASYAWLTVDGVDGWFSTYAMTPDAENIYQQFPTCETGKHINVATGNCVKDPDPPAECAEGQFRNPATGRCKKLDSEKALADCAEGQFRNPATNRCKKIASDDELSPCVEGWERNPETNRCRKTPIGSEAAYAVDPMGASDDGQTWVWIGAGGMALLAAIVAWQFHPEIARFFGKVYARIKR